jgi:phosphotriesterase-related protein
VPTVETVQGPVEVDDLGPTLMHEHVFVLSTEHVQNYGDGGWWDEEARVADAVARLTALRGKGITTIVDPTVWGIGRDIPRIQRIAEQVELNIVVATGLYAYEELPHQYAYRGPGLLLDVPEPMVADFTRDIVDGIGSTGVKAAFLKCCVEAYGLTPGVERIARAVARTHVETGAPITVHTSGVAQSGRLAVDLFGNEGVDLTKVVIGHAGDSNDLDYLMGLADAGATLGMDRFGLDIFNPTADRVRTIAALAARGYADRMVLAHDTNCFIDYFGAAHDEARAAAAPNWHYGYISDDVLPALREAGVTEAQIQQMLVDNPRRYFASAPSGDVSVPLPRTRAIIGESGTRSVP